MMDKLKILKFIQHYNHNYYSKISKSTWYLGVVSSRYFLIIFYLFLVCIPVVLLVVGDGGLASDSVKYHFPQINQFIANPYDLIEYSATATTLPFYHVFMSWVAILVGESAVGNDTYLIRIVHLSLSVPGIVAVVSMLNRYAAPRAVLFLGFPIITSWYVVSGSIFIGTDGPGFSVAALALYVATSSPKLWMRAGVITLLATGIRHMVLPFVIISGLTASLGQKSFGQLVLWGIGCVPAALLLVMYISKWGGLVPPGIATELNPQGIFVYPLLGHLALVGLWGFGFAAIRVNEWQRILSRRSTLLLVATIVVALSAIWLTTQTGPSVADGRFGSVVWIIARVGQIGDRSLSILILAILGATWMLLATLDAIEQGIMPIEMASLASLLLSLMLTYAAYQRYSEPLLLASFAVAIARLHGKRSVATWQGAGLFVLSLMGIGKFAMEMT